jgi:hypothetical protein
MSFTVGASLPQNVQEVTYDAASISNGVTTAFAITVPQAKTDQVYICDCPALETGLVILGASCKTAGAVTVWILNYTGAPIDADSHTYRFVAI